MLEICTSLSSDGMLETDFIITLTTVDNSAGENPHYVSINNSPRKFNHTRLLKKIPSVKSEPNKLESFIL